MARIKKQPMPPYDDEPSPMERQIDELTEKVNKLEKELDDLRRATWPAVFATMPIGGTYNHD